MKQKRMERSRWVNCNRRTIQQQFQHAIRDRNGVSQGKQCTVKMCSGVQERSLCHSKGEGCTLVGNPRYLILTEQVLLQGFLLKLVSLSPYRPKIVLASFIMYFYRGLTLLIREGSTTKIYISTDSGVITVSTLIYGPTGQALDLCTLPSPRDFCLQGMAKVLCICKRGHPYRRLIPSRKCFNGIVISVTNTNKSNRLPRLVKFAQLDIHSRQFRVGYRHFAQQIRSNKW